MITLYIDWTVPHVLILLLDGIVTVAAMSAYAIARAEKQAAKKRRLGVRK